MLGAAIGQTAVAIIVCDSRFSPLFLNASARRLFRIPEDFVPDRAGADWLCEAAGIDATIVSAALEQAGSWRGSSVQAAASLAAGGTRKSNIDISTFRDGDLAGFIVVAGEAEPKSLTARRASDIDLIATSRRLTSREREVMLGLLEGLSNKSIGLRMAISPRTVEFHRARLMHRFEAKSLVELIQNVMHDGPGREDV